MKISNLKRVHILYAGLGGTFDVCNILGELDKKNKSLTSFVQVGPKRFAKHVSSSRQKTYFVKTYRFLSFFYFFPILRILLSEKPSLIFLHNFSIIPVIIYKLFYNNNIKFVYVDHVPNSLRGFKTYLICKLFKPTIDHIIVLNKESYDYFLKTINLSSKKISIIPNAINKEFIRKKNKIKNIKNSLVIGMAARMNDSKRHDLIIDAIHHPILKNINVKVFFAGTGENINFLKKRVKNNKIFKFNGLLNSKKLKRWYMSIDIYIQATNGEGHSTSILQAMGMNLPVMASNVSGIKKFLIPNKNIGIIFENNPRSLAIKIQDYNKLKKNKILRLVRSQKEYVLSNYSEQIFLDAYSRVIKLIF